MGSEMCIRDRYFMRSSEANFIDMDVVAAGPIVSEQSQAFYRYWNSSVVYPVQEVVAPMPLVTTRMCTLRSVTSRSRSIPTLPGMK